MKLAALMLNLSRIMARNLRVEKHLKHRTPNFKGFFLPLIFFPDSTFRYIMRIYDIQSRRLVVSSADIGLEFNNSCHVLHDSQEIFGRFVYGAKKSSLILSNLMYLRMEFVLINLAAVLTKHVQDQGSKSLF